MADESKQARGFRRSHVRGVPKHMFSMFALVAVGFVVVASRLNTAGDPQPVIASASPSAA
jgi:hypothetical protein